MSTRLLEWIQILVKLLTFWVGQSEDIAIGVDEKEGHEQGAGDQGMMFGYASDETDVFMPAPITFAHRLMMKHAEIRRQGHFPFLRPDAKVPTNISLFQRHAHCYRYCCSIDAASSPDVSQPEIREAVIEEIIRPTYCPKNFFSDETKCYINPTGQFREWVDRQPIVG